MADDDGGQYRHPEVKKAWDELRSIDARLSETDDKLTKMLDRVEVVAGEKASGLREEFDKSKLTRENFMQKAAWHYTDASLHHIYHDHYPAEAAAWGVFCEYAWWKSRSEIAVVVLLMLTFFEVPLWCDDTTGFWRWQSAEEVCIIRGSEKGAIMSGIPLLPVGVSVLIEATCYVMYLIRFTKHTKLEEYFTRQRYQGTLTTRMEKALVFIGVVDIIYFSLHWKTDFRTAHFVRFALGGVTLKTMRKMFKDFAKIVWEIRITGLLLCGLILMWAWLMAILFDDVKAKIYGDLVNTGLRPFSTAIYTSFLTSTTVNLPYDTVPTFAWKRYVMFIWMIMIGVGCLILTQIIVAVVYNRYSDLVEDYMKSVQDMRKEALDRTFNNLVFFEGPGANDMITKETFDQFCDKLEEVPGIEKKDEEQQHLCFAWLDSGDSATAGTLNRAEFAKISYALLCNIHVIEARSWVQENGPEKFAYYCRKLCLNGPCESVKDIGREENLYDESPLDLTMKYVLFANILLIIYESFIDLDPRNTGKDEPKVFTALDLCFAFMYLAEVIIKLCVWSFEEYWFSIGDKFDLFTSLSLTIGGIMTLSWHGDYHNVLVCLTFLRLVRVLKALDHVKSFQKTLTCIKQMIKTCWDVLLMNFFVHYLWAAWGMMLFGGRMYVENPAIMAGVDAGDIDDGDLPTIEVFGFNDMVIGFVTLFLSTLTQYLDMVAAATFTVYPRGSSGWYQSYLFHYTFYVASPIVVFNIFLAFSIDVYLKLAEDSDECEKFLTSFRNYVDENHKDEDTGLIYHIKPTTELRQVLTLAAFFEVEDDDGEGDDKDGDKDGDKDDDKDGDK